MREWQHRGYLYECDYIRYPEQGAHWECVVMLPISTKDGSQTKYILFDCPQYTVDGYTVECYYWIGTFDKETCRFIADDDKPKLFDLGRGVYTGQNGVCFLTEEDIAAGKTYEDGRTILYAIAQGKDAGTAQNATAGWAHNFAIPLELWLSDDGTEVIREPIKEVELLREETLFSYEGEGMTADEINEEISEIRGDMLEIRAKIELDPTSPDYSAGFLVRYNPKTVDGKTVQINVPAGTQVGSVLRVPGEGLPRNGSSTYRGDMFVRVMIDIPKKVSAEEKELLMKLDSSVSQSAPKKPKKKGIFGK